LGLDSNVIWFYTKKEDKRKMRWNSTYLESVNLRQINGTNVFLRAGSVIA